MPSVWAVDAFRDPSGEEWFAYNSHVVSGHAVAAHSSDLFARNPDGIFVTYDMRRLVDVGIDPERVPGLIDLKAVCDENSLVAAARAHYPFIAAQVTDAASRFGAHLRAAAASNFDPRKFPISKTVDRSAIRELFATRCEAMVGLFNSRSGAVTSEWKRVRPLALALLKIEQAGIPVDVELARERVKTGEGGIAEQKLYRSVVSLARDGFVQSYFNPRGTKTGRIGVERGFACMTIPRGPAREVVVSRFGGGRICSVDLNASDFRCLVNSVNDELKQKYAGARDFHEKTRELCGTKWHRDVVKAATYTTIYGGKHETVAKQTGLTDYEAECLVRNIRTVLWAIDSFRVNLYALAQEDGRVLVGDGLVVPVSQDDHEGKVLGLYAQGASSYAFSAGVAAAERALREMKSKIIFTVHDEVVVDEHPDEDASEIVQCHLENSGPWPMVARIKKGKNYREATE